MDCKNCEARLHRALEENLRGERANYASQSEVAELSLGFAGLTKWRVDTFEYLGFIDNLRETDVL